MKFKELVAICIVLLSSLLYGCTPKSESDSAKASYFVSTAKVGFRTNEFKVKNITGTLHIGFVATDSFACKVLEKSISKNNKDSIHSKVVVDAVYDYVEEETQVTFSTVTLTNKSVEDYISGLKNAANINKHQIIDTTIDKHKVSKIAEERNGYTIFRVVVEESKNSVMRLDFLVPNKNLDKMSLIVNGAINSIKIGNK